MAVYATPSWNNKFLGRLAKHPMKIGFHGVIYSASPKMIRTPLERRIEKVQE
jgi:hypothetical protein